MAFLKQNQQRDIGQQWRMPVNNSNADILTSVSAADAWDGVIKYYNAGVLTVDAGQAAGTVVVIKLKNNNILNSIGDVIGTNNDTSFAFGTGTILTTRVAFPYRVAELYSDQSGSARANAITENFSNGQWCLDHENGIIYGKKATNGTTDTASYLIYLPATGGSSGPATNININQVAGTSTNAGQGAIGTGTLRVTEGSSTMQAQGLDATGADTYATVKTAGALATHILVVNKGANGAIISLDGGTTDHFTVLGGTSLGLDAVTIAAGVNIQAKNETAGANYTNLYVSIW